MLLFSGDDTHTDWSIGIEFCKGEPHIKSNSQCINDYYSLLNDCHGLLISWKSSVVAIIRSTPKKKSASQRSGDAHAGLASKYKTKA